MEGGMGFRGSAVDLLKLVLCELTLMNKPATKMDTPPHSDAKDGWFRPLRRRSQGLVLIGNGP